MGEPAHLGELLKRLREARGLTWKDLRAATGMSRAYTYWIETEFSAPGADLLQRILDLYNATDSDRLMAMRLRPLGVQRHRKRKEERQARKAAAEVDERAA